jgi:hypothetical protein
VGSVEVVEVLPLLELVVEELGVVDHDAVKESVELLRVDAVGSLDFAVEPGGGGADVDVADPAVDDVPVEGALELGAVEFLTAVKWSRLVLASLWAGRWTERCATPCFCRSARA